jgi:glycine/D-amino acid oxidase-like deaminating enzyme
LIEHPYWWDTLGERRVARGSEFQPAGCDVVIIGGGYTGLSAARALAKQGASVAVLEREDVGAGASSRNGGQVLTGLKPEPAALVKRYGTRRARMLFDASLESIRGVESLIVEERIDCDFQHSGHVQAASKPVHFEAFRDEQRLLASEFAHQVELIGPSEQTREIGSARYHGLLVDEASCALNPAKYVHGLAQAAIRAGARLHTHTTAIALHREHSGWHVHTGSGSIHARDVLVATDAYADDLTPALRRGLLLVGSYAIATEPLDPQIANRLLPRRRMVFDSKNFLYYFRLTADHRVLFGGRAEFSTPSESRTRHAAAILRAGLIEVFPDLAGTRIEYAWAGLVAMTRDQIPHAGRLDGMFYACGYSGHGIALATSLGEAIGRRIAGHSVRHPFIDDGLPRIPFNSGRPWFLPLIGSYYKMKDWLS